MTTSRQTLGSISDPLLQTYVETGDAPDDSSTSYWLDLWDSFEGEIGELGDHDWIAVELVEGVTYSISLSGDDGGGGTLNDPYLRLYDRDGNLVGNNDDGGPGYDSLLSFTATETGTYYIDAAAYNNSYTGSYTVTVGLQPDETNDAPADSSTGYWMGINDWFIGELDTLGDHDWIAVDLVAGQTYSFALLGTGSGYGSLADPYLRLYNGSSTLVAGNDDSGAGLDSLIHFTATTSGTYYLDAGAYNNNYTGAYTLLTFAGDMQFGGNGPNVIEGSTGADFLAGLDGNDFIDGLEGDDVIYGGDGNDSLLGREGDDYVDGGDNRDNIALQDGNDTGYGGAGNDSIGGGAGDDELYGEGGNDVIGGGLDDDYVDGGDGNDEVSGGDGNDTLFGGDGDDTMGGGVGDDFVDGWYGDDSLGGGYGNDTLWGYDGDDSIGGGTGHDEIDGEDGDDFLAGANGSDTIYGGDGADTINGGNGDDLLYGDYGLGDGDTDLFVFNAFVNGEMDTIMGFEDGIDLIRLRDVGPGAVSFSNVTGGVELEVNGHTIFVDGMSTATLTLDDLVFV